MHMDGIVAYITAIAALSTDWTTLVRLPVKLSFLFGLCVRNGSWAHTHIPEGVRFLGEVECGA